MIYKRKKDYFFSLITLSVVLFLFTACTPTTTSTTQPEIQPTVPVTPAPNDYIPNHSLEEVSQKDSDAPSDWVKGQWGTNDAKFSYLNTGHTGSHSVKVEISNYTDGDAKWYYTPQYAKPGELYTISHYYQSDVDTRVVVMAEKKDGSVQYIQLGFLSPSSTWANYSETFMIPLDTRSISVLHILASVGYLVTDDYTLVDGKYTGFDNTMVSLTFDDGWESQYSEVFPRLTEYDYKATFYLTTDFLDTQKYITTENALEMQQAGHHIGSHTLDHTNLLALSSDGASKQLQLSKQILEAEFGPINDFASPYGAYNQPVLDEIKRHYTSHRSTDVGFNAKDSFNPLNIKTQNIVATTTIEEIEQWIDRAQKDKTWLVIVFHAVDDSGSEHSMTPENFEATLNTLWEKEVAVVTVEEALTEIAA